MEDDSMQKSPPGAVESDPKKRYWRFEDVLGRGAFKTVFKAFDSREGLEVAWNKVQLGTAVNEDQLRKRLFSEIHVLKRLKHKNIMTFHDYWLDDKTNTLNFITELFTHGSLKKFRAKHKHLELKVLKKWAWQVLQGLVYLHGHEPPIIHRDLKCDNILINGVTGDLKIGDLGLATLWKGLAPLSVIGTPEFMAPEFYDEKYDEKVDVYAFGMLLLELVSMDYPYCECTNPASIYKKVSQGVFPASIQKIRTQELRKFIELCIAYEPKERPEARKLLKHPFFDGIRKCMEPERQPSDEFDLEHLGRRSESTGSLDSTRMDPLSRHGSAAAVNCNTDESEKDDDDHSESTSDGVKIRIECSKVEGEPKLNFTLKYDRPGGYLKTIRFPFDINDDTAEQIVAEMRAEGSTDLDMMITEEEAATVGHLIAMEVEKFRLRDEGELTAFVNVVRKPCDSMTESPRYGAPVDSLEAREVVESKMDDMCQTMASDLTEDNVFRTLQQSKAFMDILAADNSRRSWRPRGDNLDEDGSSEGVMTETSVLFPPIATSPFEPAQGRHSLDEGTPKSPAIEIPIGRLSTGSSMEHAHSISSTVSDSRLHSTDGRNLTTSRSIQRRLSARQFLSEGPSTSFRPSTLKSMSSMIDRQTESPAKVASPQIPVELSVFVVEPNPEIDAQSGTGLERAAESETGQNTSLISMVTMKPNLKKGIFEAMPTVPEMSATQASNASSPVAVQRPAPDSLTRLSKDDDDLQWNLENEPSADPESVTNVSHKQSAGISPPNRPESGGSTIDHGIKSPELSQDKVCGRSDVNASLASQLRMTEEAGKGSGASTGCQSLEDIKDSNPYDQDQALETAQATTELYKLSPKSHNDETDLKTQPVKTRPLTADALQMHTVFTPPTPHHCRSAFELGAAWSFESIRAFRREEEAPSMTNEAKQSVSRLFNSCASFSHLSTEASEMKQHLFSSTPGFDQAMHPSASDVALLHLADPHPFLNLAPPVPKGVRVRDTLVHYHSDELPCATEFSDDSLILEMQKHLSADGKELQRQKDLDHDVQEQQLAGLSPGASPGVSKALEGEHQQPSVNGS